MRDDTSTAATSTATSTKLTDASFTAFQPCSTEEVRKFLIRSPPKSCSLDPCPRLSYGSSTSCSRSSASCACNVSFQHCLLLESQKAAIVTPILKKHDLDPDDVKSYRPISNLTFISKVIERIVASQLTGYLLINRLLPDHHQPTDRGTSRKLLFLRSSQIFWTQLTRLR